MLNAKIGIIFIFAIKIALCGDAVDAGDAMFGLTWGMSSQKIKAMGISIEKMEGNNNLYFYRTDSLPKNISISEFYTLIFDEDSSLVKIVMYSTTIKNDPYGIFGKEKFDNIINLLKQKYRVEQQTFCYTGRKLYEEPDEFYQCLKYPGCGNWIVLLSSENKNISVELTGLDRAAGFIIINVEAIPGFSNAIDKFKAKKEAKDRDAF